MDQVEKVRENRLRRAAQRQGLIFQKSRRRDGRALDYGLYRLVNAHGNFVVSVGYPDGWNTLDAIEGQLEE